MCRLMKNIVKTSVHLGIFFLLVSIDFIEKPIKLLLKKLGKKKGGKKKRKNGNNVVYCPKYLD